MCIELFNEFHVEQEMEAVLQQFGKRLYPVVLSKEEEESRCASDTTDMPLRSCVLGEL